MNTTFTVTRQKRWDTGERVVEVSAGGIDYTNPDALCKAYNGEFEEFKGMVDALEAAINIAEMWKADLAKSGGKEKILIGVGDTHGFTLPFDGLTACKTNYAKLRREAKKYDEQLPKCDHCGDILSDERGEQYGNEMTAGEYPYCSEKCAMRSQEDWEMENLALAEADAQLNAESDGDV